MLRDRLPRRLEVRRDLAGRQFLFMYKPQNRDALRLSERLEDFSSVHIGDPSANQATSFEIQLIQSIQEVSKRTLRTPSHYHRLITRE